MVITPKKKKPEEKRGKGKEKEVKVKEVESEEKKVRKSKPKKEVDIDAWIEANINEFVEMTGLSILNLSRDQYIELLHDILTQLYGSTTTRTPVETVVKRYNRYKDRLNEVIASRLAYMLDRYTIDQLEFIVFNVGVNVLNIAPKIYAHIVRAGRDDLLKHLRSKWSSAWLARRSQNLPVECPKCGFNSLMPDMTCLVCGSYVTEPELKKYVGFNNILKSFLELLDCNDLKTLTNYDTVLLNASGLKSPTQARSVEDIEIYLSAEEKKLIRETYKVKCGLKS